MYCIVLYVCMCVMCFHFAVNLGNLHFWHWLLWVTTEHCHLEGEGLIMAGDITAKRHAWEDFVVSADLSLIDNLFYLSSLFCLLALKLFIVFIFLKNKKGEIFLPSFLSSSIYRVQVWSCRHFSFRDCRQGWKL